MSNKTAITVNINRREYAIAVESRRTLADAIREDCGLTGTHIGCEHGVCGACTVIVDDEPMRSCLMFAVQADGKKIRTVEGLADGDRLHPMQQAFMDHHAAKATFPNCIPSRSRARRAEQTCGRIGQKITSDVALIHVTLSAGAQSCPHNVEIIVQT